jgi:Ca-activated chloride channel family protein
MQAERAAAPGFDADTYAYSVPADAARAPVGVGTQGGANGNQPNAGAGQKAQGMGGMGGAMGGMGPAGEQRYGRTPPRLGQATGRQSTFAAANPAQALSPVPGNGQGQVALAQAKVRQIGTKTFYFKNGRWVDSSVKPEEDAKASKVVQFSEDYFRLARSQKAEYNQYFSQEEPVTVKLDGQVYHIDPAPEEAGR